VVVLLVLAPVVAVAPTILYAKATPVTARIDYCSYHRRGHTTCMLSWTLDGKQHSGQISWMPGPLNAPVHVRVKGRFVVPRPLPFIVGSVAMVGLAAFLATLRRRALRRA
jgi:hypothetical protein